MLQRSLLLMGLLAALSGWGCSKAEEPPQPRGATVAVEAEVVPGPSLMETTESLRQSIDDLGEDLDRILANSQQVDIVLRRGGDLPIELRAVIMNESMSIEPGDEITVRAASRKP